MKKSKLILLGLTLSTVFSCVSSKKYEQLEARYRNLSRTNRTTNSDKKALQSEYDKLEDIRSQLKSKSDSLDVKLKGVSSNYKNLQGDFSKTSENLKNNLDKNKELNTQLESLRDRLKIKQDSLEKVASSLELKINRINELEGLLNEQKSKTDQLKNSISKALKGFEGKGLTVEEREGKIYVSMDNKLLFAPAKWKVEQQGQAALAELGQVLSEQKDLNILIEGHTDGNAYSGNSVVKDNWDLSVLRATSITKILQKTGVLASQLSASGRGEYQPIADNRTTEGRAKNRRVEIILTPKFAELTKLLNEI